MSPIAIQPVEAALTGSALFLTLTVSDAGLTGVRGLCADLESLVKAVGFRSASAGLSCILGVGAGLWGRLGLGPAPAGLHPFAEIAGVHRAPATPGDLFLHIRAERPDFCFELATHAMRRLGPGVTVADETQGFRYFDNRDLLGFVDGTENPQGAALTEAVLIGDEDPEFAGGSYVIVQKYLHDMEKWEAMPVEAQERVIGRHKLSDIEFPDAEKATHAHNVLTNITDAAGNPLEILRDNMPFGAVGRGEFGTYFIGYAREPGRIETMLRNMFVGNPPGNYDRILDVSRAVTGCLFFVPPPDLLERIGAAAEPAPAATGSLGLGSLKGET